MKRLFLAASFSLVVASCGKVEHGPHWTAVPAGYDGIGNAHTYRVWEVDSVTGQIRMCSYSSADAMGVTCSDAAMGP